MAGFIVIVFSLLGAAVSFFILYLVIRAAVRDGILEANADMAKVNAEEARRINRVNNINQVTCPGCGNSYDLDYRRCPHCQAVNENVL